VSMNLTKMTTEGEGFRQNDRRNSLGNFIQKQDFLLGRKDFDPKLSFEEFESKVDFKYGIPLIILHLVDTLIGTTFLKDLFAQVNPPRLLERFDY